MRCAPGSARGSVDQAEAEEGGHKMNLHVWALFFYYYYFLSGPQPLLSPIVQVSTK
jgi:hypothetical protein